jgi:hypothetical protein
LLAKAAPAFTPTAFQPYPTPSGGKANWLAMKVPYFEYYLKDQGQPFPKVSVQKSSDPKLARFSINAPHPITKAEVYWAKATPAELTVEDVKNREWTAMSANKVKNGTYEAALPAEAAE